jgi:hypothetical protein
VKAGIFLIRAVLALLVALSRPRAPLATREVTA